MQVNSCKLCRPAMKEEGQGVQWVSVAEGGVLSEVTANSLILAAGDLNRKVLTKNRSKNKN